MIQENERRGFLRTMFICIIWTSAPSACQSACSWGLCLFVLFEPSSGRDYSTMRSWGLCLFVLFELLVCKDVIITGSWGLCLFVLFEQTVRDYKAMKRSWGLSLFALFGVFSGKNPYGSS